uniref:DUF4283 domain-containing protein n=1 Tax=Oryza nivara TaxID=4536 RepID=A0A0E0IHE6_ORYNI
MRWRLLIKGVASPMKAKVVGGKGAGGGQRLTLAPGASANLWSQPAVPKETWGVAQGEEEDERNWWPEVLAATPCRTSPEVSTWDKKGCSRGGFSAPTKYYAVEPLCVPKPVALGSRFWALGDESSEDEVDREERRLEEEVSSCSMNSGFVGNRKLAKKMVEKVVNQKTTTCKPWKGPLPKARVSQTLTFGDVIGVALKKKKRASVASPVRFTTVNRVNSPVAEENLDRVNKSLASMRLPVVHTCSIMEKAAAAPPPLPPAAVRSSLDDNAKTLKFLMNLDKREKEGRIVLMSPGGQCTSDIEASKRSVELLSKGGSEHKFVSFGGERSRREVTIAWRGEGSGRSDGRGRESGDGFWEEEEEFFGARFDAGRLGFEPGYGFGQQGNHGWGQQRSGFRPRGSRSFGPRRGGFAGRPGRGGWENNRFSTKRFGERPLLKNEGRPGGGINKAGGGSKFAAKGEVGGGVSGGGGGASAGKGKVKVGDMEVVVNQMDGAVVVTDDPETNSELAILDCDPSLFFDQHVREDISKIQAQLKIELQRAITYGGADVKENGVLTGARLKFEEWNEKEEGILLPKVWVRVFGLRKKLREYLNLWAVGSLLGATQTVDMKMTRKNDFGRIFVAVLNPRIIPKNLDVVIGDHFFELEIVVEKMGFDENGEEVEIEQDDRDGDGLEENKEDKHDGDGRDGRVTKRAKNDDMLVDGKENGTAEGKDDAALNGNQCQHKMKESEISAIASGILDVAVGKVMNEVCDMVMEEIE